MGAKTMSAEERCDVQARYIKELEKEVLESRRKLGELKGEVQALHETSDLYNDEINALKEENAGLTEELEIVRKNMRGVDDFMAEFAAERKLKAENAKLREALVQIRGWREIGHADTLGEKLRAIEEICDDALAQQEGDKDE